MVASTGRQRSAARLSASPGRICLIAKPGNAATGVGRYVAALQAHLDALGADVARAAPSVPPLPALLYAGLRRARVDLRTFLLNYPVWAGFPPADVYHITSQNLASLLPLGRPRGRTVVTVHDIIPYMLRDDPRLCVYRTAADRLFDRLAMSGLRRADHLIADSDYTRRSIVEHLGIPAERISVVHLGVDHGRFRVRPRSDDLPERYGLPRGRRYLIYVGSEDPRKNLPTLLRAVALARRGAPDLALIKVGRAHFERERERLRALAAALGLEDAVFWLGDVLEDDLPGLYALAEAAVQPSLFEGFGFPLLEAMACGTPAIYARAASLPELAGDAGLGFDPRAVDAEAALAALIGRVLEEPALRAQLRETGIRQAAAFTWERTVGETARVYSAA